eukprot:5857221-Alexandrium_andersonii.AAC.1
MHQHFKSQLLRVRILLNVDFGGSSDEARRSTEIQLKLWKRQRRPPKFNTSQQHPSKVQQIQPRSS